MIWDLGFGILLGFVVVDLLARGTIDQSVKSHHYSQNAVAIESIVIAHEGVYQVPAVGLVTSIVSGVASLF